MEIKKIAELTDEETEKLVEAGKLLKAIKISGENNEFDDLSSDLRELIYALQIVCGDIVHNN